jgi:arylsulfatase A-like enzyme
LLALLTLVGCRGQNREPRQAILILLDAARADRFSSYGYERTTTPHMDRLAAGGLLFRNHYTQGTATRKALPALLYSRYFTNPIFSNSRQLPLFEPATLFRRLDAEAIALPKVLRGAGFVTTAISAHVFIRPETEFAQEFDTLHDLGTMLDYDRKYGAPRAAETIDFAIDWMDDHSNQDFFLYLHLMDTHFPHFFEEDAKELLGNDEYDASRFDEGGGIDDSGGPLSPAERRYLDALYDGSLRYADRQIGRLIDFLEKSSRLQDTLIAITSDHGEVLLDRPGRLQHGGEWVEPLARIPLIIHYPRKVRPARVDSFSDLVDVGPTILGLLGVPLPEGKTADGVDLARIAAGEAPPKVFALIDGGIRDRRYKALFKVAGNVLRAETPIDVGRIRGKLYDLQADPNETRNVFVRQRDVAGALWSRYWSEMAPRYRRYAAAVSEAPPSRPFAVGSWHFATETPMQNAPPDLPLAQLLETASQSGWLKNARHRQLGIFATPSARPLALRIPVPNGSYDLSVAMAGSCVVEVGGAARTLEQELGNRIWQIGDQVDFGRIQVAAKSFAAVVRPAEGRWCSINAFGFRPLAGEPHDSETDGEVRERMRVLGYVE